jgi:transcriptional regulator with XRE-family HTH domain
MIQVMALDELRAAEDLRQEQLAEVLHVRQAAISKVELLGPPAALHSFATVCSYKLADVPSAALGFAAVGSKHPKTTGALAIERRI